MYRKVLFYQIHITLSNTYLLQLLTLSLPQPTIPILVALSFDITVISRASPNIYDISLFLWDIIYFPRFPGLNHIIIPFVLAIWIRNNKLSWNIYRKYFSLEASNIILVQNYFNITNNHQSTKSSHLRPNIWLSLWVAFTIKYVIRFAKGNPDWVGH